MSEEDSWDFIITSCLRYTYTLVGNLSTFLLGRFPTTKNYEEKHTKTTKTFFFLPGETEGVGSWGFLGRQRLKIPHPLS